MLLRWDDREASAPTSVSVGELLPSAEAKIMDAEDTNEVPQGQSGELWCRSPNVMKGYWRNVKATEETLTKDGWLKTGDIAYVDQSGKFFIVDRKKVSVAAGRSESENNGKVADPQTLGVDQS